MKLTKLQRAERDRDEFAIQRDLWRERAGQLQAEVERLRRDALTLGHNLVATTDERDKLQAEVERLREDRNKLYDALHHLWSVSTKMAGVSDEHYTRAIRNADKRLTEVEIPDRD
jgi:septal ring factor EnvC (AmiA/AmiB activator)